MFKQVFDYNGTPYVLRTNTNGDVLESEKEKYSLFVFTDIMPPSNLYPPRRFDGEEWYGVSSEEYENNNKPPLIEPDETEKIIANLQMQLISLNKEVDNLKRSGN